MTPLTFPAEYARDGRWILVAETRETHVWLDTASLEGARTPTPGGWLRYQFPGSAASATMERFAVDCAARTIHHRAYYEYGRDGRLVGHGLGEPAPSAVIPESVDEHLLEQLCTGVPTPPRGPPTHDDLFSSDI